MKRLSLIATLLLFGCSPTQTPPENATQLILQCDGSRDISITSASRGNTERQRDTQRITYLIDFENATATTWNGSKNEWRSEEGESELEVDNARITWLYSNNMEDGVIVKSAVFDRTLGTVKQRETMRVVGSTGVIDFNGTCQEVDQPSTERKF